MVKQVPNCLPSSCARRLLLHTFPSDIRMRVMEMIPGDRLFERVAQEVDNGSHIFVSELARSETSDDIVGRLHHCSIQIAVRRTHIRTIIAFAITQPRIHCAQDEWGGVELRDRQRYGSGED